VGPTSRPRSAGSSPPPLGQGWLYSPAVPRELLGQQLARVYPVPEVVAVEDDTRV